MTTSVWHTAQLNIGYDAQKQDKGSRRKWWFISEIKEAKLIEDPIKLKFCGFPFNQAHVEFENTEFCKNMGWTIFYSHFPHVHTMYLLWMNDAFI